MLEKLAQNLLAVVALLCACSPAFAVNKCTTKEGKIVYQDAACSTADVSGESVRTWDNTPGSYHPGAASRDVQPDDKIVGPTQATGLLRLYRRWIDAEKLAMSTGRIALAGPVSTLQAIQREAESMEAPACLSKSKTALVALTSKSVEAFILFMQKQELTGTAYQLSDRSKLIAAFEHSMENTKCGSQS